MKKRVLVIHGPNINLTGEREVGVYGKETIDTINEDIRNWAAQLGLELVEIFQSNSEGAIIDKIQERRHDVDGIAANMGAYTHYSIAIRDAICACNHRVVEVHVSNIHAREEFRHHSMLAPIIEWQFVGLGAKGYEMAFRYLVETDQEKDAQQA